MSAYEELVERIEPYVLDYDRRNARAMLAEVLRTLETVTPEMLAVVIPGRSERAAKSVWNAMLRASPLTPK